VDLTSADLLPVVRILTSYESGVSYCHLQAAPDFTLRWRSVRMWTRQKGFTLLEMLVVVSTAQSQCVPFFQRPGKYRNASGVE
jgi:O-succinylbenzoate synthase